MTFDGDADDNLPGVNSEGNQNTTGSAATSTEAIGGVKHLMAVLIMVHQVLIQVIKILAVQQPLTTARNIGGATTFDGSADDNLPGVNSEVSKNTTGSAATLTTARNIGGVAFDGSADINLPGVNSEGNQNTTGSAATLTTARNIGGAATFIGGADINLPGVNSEGNQNTTGSAATLTTARNIIGGLTFNEVLILIYQVLIQRVIKIQPVQQLL